MKIKKKLKSKKSTIEWKNVLLTIKLKTMIQWIKDYKDYIHITKMIIKI